MCHMCRRFAPLTYAISSGDARQVNGDVAGTAGIEMLLGSCSHAFAIQVLESILSCMSKTTALVAEDRVSQDAESIMTNEDAGVYIL